MPVKPSRFVNNRDLKCVGLCFRKDWEDPSAAGCFAVQGSYSAVQDRVGMPVLPIKKGGKERFQALSLDYPY